jgi:hypothetical protein
VRGVPLAPNLALLEDRPDVVLDVEIDVVLANILGPLLEGVPGIPVLLLQVLESIVVLQGIAEELPRVRGSAPPLSAFHGSYTLVHRDLGPPSK